MRRLTGLILLWIVAIAGCRGVTWPTAPTHEPASFVLTDRQLEKPDVSSLPKEIDTTPAKPQGYYRLTAEDCRILACRSSSLGNLMANGAPQFTRPGANMGIRYACDMVRSSASCYLSTEARNRSAGAALTVYYRILELELKSDVLSSSIAELDALIKANEVLSQKGFKQTADSHELRKQRLELDSDRAKLRAGLMRLNSELKAMLSIDPGTEGFFLPADQVKVVPDPLDMDSAVQLALHVRADLNLLRAVGNMVDTRTVIAVRQVLVGVAPPLAALLQRDEMLMPDFFATFSPVAKADVCILRKQIYHLLLDRERETAKDVRTAIHDWSTARELVTFSRKRFDLIQERVTELEKRAKIGQAVELDLRKARLELLQAESDLIGEISKWKIADVKAREVMGLLCDDQTK